MRNMIFCEFCKGCQLFLILSVSSFTSTVLQNDKTTIPPCIFQGASPWRWREGGLGEGRRAPPRFVPRTWEAWRAPPPPRSGAPWEAWRAPPLDLGPPGRPGGHHHPLDLPPPPGAPKNCSAKKKIVNFWRPTPILEGLHAFSDFL